MLLIAGWLGPAPAVYAQAEPLAPGREARLFVRGAGTVLEGMLTSVSREALEIGLRDGSTFTVSPAQLERAEVLASRHNALRGGIVGGFVGLGAGVALVVSDEETNRAGSDEDFGTAFEPWKLIVSPLVGVALGAAVGRLIHTPRWAPAFVPAPGDFALAWTVAVS